MVLGWTQGPWDSPVRRGKEQRCRSRSDGWFQECWEDERPHWGCERKLWCGAAWGQVLVPR